MEGFLEDINTNQRNYSKNENNETIAKRPERFLNIIALEVATLIIGITLAISTITTQNLMLEKACRFHLNYSDEICTALKQQSLNDTNEYEREIQKLITIFMTWRSYLIASIPGIMALFVGSWIDKTGQRKCFLLIAISGQFLVTFNDIINVYFFFDSNLIFLTLSESLIESCSGSTSIILLTSLSHTSAIAIEERRTFRMGVLCFAHVIGYSIGTSVAGILLKRSGYCGNYGLNAVLQIIVLAYVAYFFKDAAKTQEQNKFQEHRSSRLLRSFFDPSIIKDLLKVVFKRRPGKQRLKICMLLAIVSLVFGPLYGEMMILYMYTRYRFSWDEVKFSLFQTYNTIVHTIGSVCLSVVFSKIFGWQDSFLGIICTISNIAEAFAYCFASNQYFLYIAPIVGLFNGTTILFIRSLLSKQISIDEIGKVYSMVPLTENLTPLVYVPLFTSVYAASLTVLPGTVFLLDAVLTLLPLATFCWLFYEYKVQIKKGDKKIVCDVPLIKTKSHVIV